MWLGIGIALTVILLITILIAISEVYCKIQSLEDKIDSIIDSTLVELENTKKVLVKK